MRSHMKPRKFKLGELVQSVNWHDGGEFFLHAGESEPVFNSTGTNWSSSDIGMVIEIFSPKKPFFGIWYKIIVPGGVGWTTGYDIIKPMKIKTFSTVYKARSKSRFQKA